MKKTRYYSLLAVSLISAGFMTVLPVNAANTQTISQHQQNAQVPYSPAAFAAAKSSGQPFLLAFHKKGCSMCVAQQNALNKVLSDAQFKHLTVLVVDYDNDTPSLQQFNVGRQGTLILFKGDTEINRSNALTKASAIEMQLKG